MPAPVADPEFKRNSLIASAHGPAPQELISKVECLVELSAEERSALQGLPSKSVRIRAGEPLCHLGEIPTRSFLLLEGVGCSSRKGADGQRQITSFHIPGDMPDLRALLLRRVDSDITAITACRLALFEHSDLLVLCRGYPRIAEALWRCTLVVGSVFQEWIINVGSRSAVNRLAHLFCEMMLRLEAVGLARHGSCELPLTQDHLAQAIGLSRIHVNRSLQDLRKLGLLSFKNGQLTIHDREGLARVGQFDPAYLFLPQPHWRAAQIEDTSD